MHHIVQHLVYRLEWRKGRRHIKEMVIAKDDDEAKRKAGEELGIQGKVTPRSFRKNGGLILRTDPNEEPYRTVLA